MTDIRKLKGLAEAADQSEWGVVIPASPASNPAGAAILIGPRRVDTDRMAAFNAADARFIAAANPAALLELIAELESTNARLHEVAVACATAEQERDQLKADGADVWGLAQIRADTIDKLKAENEALRKIISDSATSCGAAVSVECSLDFMAHLPAEIFSVISKLRNALAECSGSLHAEMLQKFGGQRPDAMHPVTRREYDRDMAEIACYRAVLVKESAQ